MHIYLYIYLYLYIYIHIIGLYDLFCHSTCQDLSGLEADTGAVFALYVVQFSTKKTHNFDEFPALAKKHGQGAVYDYIWSCMISFIWWYLIIFDCIWLCEVSSSIISYQWSVVLFELLECCPVPAISVKAWHLSAWKERSSWSTRRAAIHHPLANSNRETFHVIRYGTLHTFHACIHACMHPCIHPYIHTSIHACMHTDMHAYMHTYRVTCHFFVCFVLQCRDV